MSAAGLRLDQAPPFFVPLRFFITAPIFGALAAATLLAGGPQALASRWTPTALAATHLLTLGFLTMTMVGALMQLLPVLAGSPLRHPRTVATVVHGLLSAGTLALAANFLIPGPVLQFVSLAALSVGLGVFLFAAGASLARARSDATVLAMRLAATGLLITLLIGVLIGLGGTPSRFSADKTSTDMHLASGLIGWIAILVMGVAYQVVPMFQLTRAYPSWLRRWLVPLLFVALLLWIIAARMAHALPALFAALSLGLVATVLAIFAVTTLWLQSQRKRRLPDATVRFWTLSMIGLLAAVAIMAGHAVGIIVEPRFALLAVAWLIVGFGISAVHGMLYKIVPFLAWLHLNAAGASSAQTNMKAFLPDSQALPHVWLHAAAVALLAPAVLADPRWIYPAALALLGSFIWLGRNLVLATLLYLRLQRASKSPQASTEKIVGTAR